MNQFWNLFAIVLFCVHCSTTVEVANERSCTCTIDYSNRFRTVHNLKYNCNKKQLKRIFSDLPAGMFPPNGKLKGTILIEGLQNQNIWNGKKIKYEGGVPPHDRGTLTNILFRRIEMFNADIFRINAPIDGKEAFELNYKQDPFVFFIVDYIREVQKNVYLGIMTFRPFEKIPVLYFLLEKM